MDTKIKKFPISYSERRKNMKGPLCVECQVSGRYLRFHEKSDVLKAGEFITVDVMAMQNEEDKPAKKICELVITREDIMEALKHISPDE
ncbi:hypothetical protein [Pseudoflavonifractor phocaeensis]|uniref:hypothetical protein n=1 Tax=Pseudoflavonifractor phocaeensis TaxID=1870988 RepID=UPI001959EC14|nr:hypothetical protein [Pseudoflavonifractor phocaeensis]MBM6871367.1 hypothetical protein [Pseudoflavonifractor phocaeensis]